jgi:hypothetical protein
VTQFNLKSAQLCLVGALAFGFGCGGDDTVAPPIVDAGGQGGAGAEGGQGGQGGAGNQGGQGGAGNQGGQGGQGGGVTPCPDRDQDGFQANSCNPNPAAGGGDCDDENNSVRPGRDENCANEVDNDCNGQPPATDPVCIACPDLDNDGYEDADCNPNRDGGGDCNDQIPEVNPGVGERCGNGQDDDCAGGDVPCLQNCTDRDLDGFGEGAGCRGPDCDDTRADVNPWRSEVCGDGVDQDCNGEDLSCDADCEDGDRDGFGEGEGCIDSDCNDGDATINPGARDIAGDGVDQDCNDGDLMLPDNCIDVDQDGYGEGPGCFAPDCDDGDPRVNEGRTEICSNGKDDDCLGGDRPCVRMGEGECIDMDGDGFGPGACPKGSLDCNDDDANVNPDAMETCNGIDDNCNEQIDECPLRNQVCDGDRCVGGAGSPCRGADDCGDDFECFEELGQCRVARGRECADGGDCGPTAECILLDVCDEDATRCYEGKGGECDVSCDCTGAFLCGETGRCVECLRDANCTDEVQDTCTGGGYCVELVGVGGDGVDAQSEVLRRVLTCWRNNAESNEAVGCDALAIEEPIIIGGQVVNEIPAGEFFEDYACDGDALTAAGFDEDEQDILTEVFGCGLFDLINFSWPNPLQSSIGDVCIYYAPELSGFSLPQRTRAAVVVDACDITVFE